MMLRRRSFAFPAWLLTLAAIVIDARSFPAELLLARCREAAWFAGSGYAGLAEHIAAFPWTAACMVLMCLPAPRGLWAAWWKSALTQTALMAAAMWPACAVASVAALTVPAHWMTMSYGITMVIVSAVIVHASRLCFRLG